MRQVAKRSLVACGRSLGGGRVPAFHEPHTVLVGFFDGIPICRIAGFHHLLAKDSVHHRRATSEHGPQLPSEHPISARRWSLGDSLGHRKRDSERGGC